MNQKFGEKLGGGLSTGDVLSGVPCQMPAKMVASTQKRSTDCKDDTQVIAIRFSKRDIIFYCAAALSSHDKFSLIT